MSNYISADFPDDKEQDALGHITAAINDMPFLLKLDKSSKRGMTSLDDSHSPFVAKCLQYGQKHTDVIPPYVDMVELNKDLLLFNKLQGITRDVNQLAEMLNDTRIAAGTDAYTASLSIYNSFKQAAKMGVPGTQTIVDDLKKAFDGQGSTVAAATAATADSNKN